MINLEYGDVVWSGSVGGEGRSAYHICFQTYAKHNGCWCPPEAVDFFRSIGIHVYDSKGYSSKLAVAGCYFYSGSERARPPHVEEAYWAMFTNRYNSHKLLKQY